jgi:hypothetical protein
MTELTEKEKLFDAAYVRELTERIRRRLCWCGKRTESGGFCDEHNYIAKIHAKENGVTSEAWQRFLRTQKPVQFAGRTKIYGN